MTTVHAYAATEANGSLEPFEYELGPIGPEDVDIQKRNVVYQSAYKGNINT